MENPYIGTLVHEIGHHVHSIIAVEELEGWEEILHLEKKGQHRSAVSEYVSYAKGKDTDLGDLEDFAESFRLFITQPARFQFDFPKRYQFMMGLVEKYTSEEERNIFQKKHAEVIAQEYNKPPTYFDQRLLKERPFNRSSIQQMSPIISTRIQSGTLTNDQKQAPTFTNGRKDTSIFLSPTSEATNEDEDKSPWQQRLSRKHPKQIMERDQENEK